MRIANLTVATAENWLDCLSRIDIAELIGVDQATVNHWIDAFAADADFASPPGATDKNPCGVVWPSSAPRSPKLSEYRK